MSDWLAKITAWLVALVQGIFTQLVTWIHDAALWVFDGVLSALAAAVNAISVPSFLSGGVNVGSYLSGMPAFTLYLLQQLNIGACLSVLGAGIAFRLVRKAVTLGQW